MSQQPESVVPTVGEIARRLKVPVHRVDYLIRSRGRTPVARAGNLRVFSEDDIEWIRKELSRGQQAEGGVER